MTGKRYKSPLHAMTRTTPTCLWNDSASQEELTCSIGHGAVGATCNPVIVLDVLKKEMHLWKDRISQLIEEMPEATEDEIGWRLVERGLQRREKERLDIAPMGPVCTIMVGRLDYWLKAVANKQNITVEPGVSDWAGVAVFKKAYKIFQDRGYRLRLLSAAFRHHLHWSEFMVPNPDL